MMNRVNLKCFVAFFMMLLLIAPAGNAYAQQKLGFYVGAYAGYVSPQDMHWDVNTAGVSFDVDTDSTGIIGGKFGWVPPAAEYLALEVDLNYTLESNYGPTTVSGVTESGDIYLSNILFNLLLRYPEGRFHPYIGAGIGFSYFNIEGFETVGGRSYYTYEDDYTFAWQFIAGVDFEVAPNWSVDLTYRYFGTNPSLLYTDIEYQVSIITAGFKFHF
jgi:opacity protein-like surface antigen